MAPPEPSLDALIAAAQREQLSLDDQKKLVAELQRSNEELKQFAYVVSHDLKAPLRAIGSLAQWIVEDYAEALDEDGQEQLSLLQSRVKRMENLINGVLQYSRIGRLRDQWEEVDMGQLLPEIIDLLAPPETIHVTVAGDLPTIQGEKVRLGQLFQNLLSNAIKFMDKPEGRVTISCHQEESMWRFSVEDNGPGIDAKHHESIFQIFHTLQARDTFESTGIGLTLVKKIAELHNGTIQVDSSPGKGSRFMVLLPRSQTAERQE
ncbi:MAG: GHKL domain-containing protein [Magnetococcales bacterium]|nr:GHKL domain-containing protein [Magnetococcales bacterium]